MFKQMGVTEQTYYRWRKEYGGLRMEQAKRLKALEKGNALSAHPAVPIWEAIEGGRAPVHLPRSPIDTADSELEP